jgi:hypothetical protein
VGLLGERSMLQNLQHPRKSQLMPALTCFSSAQEQREVLWIGGLLSAHLQDGCVLSRSEKRLCITEMSLLSEIQCLGLSLQQTEVHIEVKKYQQYHSPFLQH